MTLRRLSPQKRQIAIEKSAIVTTGANTNTDITTAIETTKKETATETGIARIDIVDDMKTEMTSTEASALAILARLATETRSARIDTNIAMIDT
jgi:hypothetical protein